MWHVSDATPTTISGQFSATCGDGITIEATGSGQLDGNTAHITVAGTATYAGITCDFSLSGTGVIENNDTLTIPYSGTTCIGPVSGTERLHRPAPAAEPTPEPPPPPPSGPSYPTGSMIEVMRAVRAEFPENWTHADRGRYLNKVAWIRRQMGEPFGLLRKPAGNRCPTPQGVSISCDYLVYEPTMNGYDVLRDERTPTWPGLSSPSDFFADRPDRYLAPVAP
jgi:hypothetical protein